MLRCSLLAILIICISTSCGSGSSPEIPYAEEEPVAPDGEMISIAYLRSFYDHKPLLIDREIYIRGRLVSTDQHGAFYKTFVLEDDTGGIEIMVDIENYHRRYEVGEILKIACNSLVISEYGKNLQLNAANGYIAAERLNTILTREGKAENFLPLPLTIDRIEPSHVSRRVCFDEVQFEEQGTWANGVLVDRTGHRLLVHTAPRAAFADRMRPTKSGYIEGILGYFNGEYQLEPLGEIYHMMSGERF